MNKIKVLHITPLLTVGGAEKKLMYILRKLDKGMFSQHVIYSIPGPLKEEAEKEGVPLVRIHPMSRSPLSLVSLWRIYKYIKKNEIDLVHCHLDAAYIIGGIAALLARVPLIFSFQNMGDEQYLSEYKVFKYLDRALSVFTEKILVESEDVMKVLLSWNIKPEKLLVIPNGVEIPDDSGTAPEANGNIKRKLGIEGCFLVGNMARLVDFKNHKLLIEAAARVINVKPDTKFFIIGDGPLKDELKDLSDRLGISKNVSFPGTLTDFAPYLMSFDIFVLSSFTESTPMALLHALAFRLPVISTAVGDIPSIIQDGINGILVPSDDADALANSILDLMEDKDKRERLANAGRETAKKKFSIESNIEKTREVYLSVLAGRGKIEDHIRHGQEIKG